MILIVFLSVYGAISLTNDIFELVKAKRFEKIINKKQKGCVIMLVSNVREATYVCQKSGVIPNVVKLREGSKYEWGFDFVVAPEDKQVLKELFEFRFEYESHKEIREQFEKEMNVDILVYLKRMLNAKK